MPAATETAIIAAFPAAEPVVAPHRQLLDPSAAWGVPAHVTILYPFVAPTELDERTLSRAAAVAGELRAVDVTFRRVGWFDTRVAYLEPAPGDWFRAATAAMHNAFPDCPPYGGAFDDVVPHLTLGEGPDEQALARAAAEVAADLPIVDRIESLLLMAGRPAPGSWTTIAQLRLGGP